MKADGFKMAQENTVSFKVFLHIRPDKWEVRRFGIDRDVVSNFTYFSEKLQNVFSTLRNNKFIVYWKDAEGDAITISTDEELIIALTEIQGDVRKLYVIMKEDSSKVPVKEDSSKRAGGKTHPGVMCDECESGVTGHRYKCLECPNFDLCSSCESKGLHPDHFVIRLPVPVSWRPHFGKRLAHYLSKSSRRCSTCPGDDTAEEGEGCHYGRGHRAPRGGLLDALGVFVDGFVKNMNYEYPAGRSGSGSEEKAKDSEGATANGQTQTSGDSSKTKDEPSAAGKNLPADSEKKKVQYLQRVGEAVANLLDPYGIDVDVRVETNKTSEDSETTKPTEEKAKKNVSFAGDAATEIKVEKPKAPVLPQVLTETVPDPEIPEKDGWTLVNGGGTNQDGQKDESSSTSKTEAGRTIPAPSGTNSSTGAVPKNHGYPVFYPPPPPTFTNVPIIPPFSNYQTPPWQIPPLIRHPTFHPIPVVQPQQQQQQQQQQQPQQQNLPRPQLHPDQKINQAVESMMSMGFSNEGGWLTQLVEMKNGDIDKVLDLLQPVKNN